MVINSYLSILSTIEHDFIKEQEVFFYNFTVIYNYTTGLHIR